LNHVLVDASVAMKWVIEEELSDRAESLLEDTIRSGSTIVGPPHLAGEVANALYQRTLRSQHTLTRSEAEEALAAFLAIPIQMVTSEDLYIRSFTFALQAGLPSLYDSMYVVLAQMLNAELWTDDRRLLRSVAQIASWVRWIGDY
jgi:predicted nucleic acid-binding protein